MQTKSVVVESYNPKWKVDFETIKIELENVLKDVIIAIEHVGSTSVAVLVVPIRLMCREFYTLVDGNIR